MTRNEESCTLDDKAFTHYSITRRGAGDLSLSLSRVRPLLSDLADENMSETLCSMCRPRKKLTSARRNVRGNAGNRNRPPFYPGVLTMRETIAPPSEPNLQFSLDSAEWIGAMFLFFFLSFQRTRFAPNFRTVVSQTASSPSKDRDSSSLTFRWDFSLPRDEQKCYLPLREIKILWNLKYCSFCMITWTSTTRFKVKLILLTTDYRIIGEQRVWVIFNSIIHERVSTVRMYCSSVYWSTYGAEYCSWQLEFWFSNERSRRELKQLFKKSTEILNATACRF